MVDTRRRVRATLTDVRIWGLTVLLLAWPAIGILAKANLLLESATPLVYAYLLVFHAVVPDVLGFELNWVGFVPFCFAVATALVGAFDRVRVRYTASERSDLSRWLDS